MFGTGTDVNQSNDTSYEGPEAQNNLRSVANENTIQAKTPPKWGFYISITFIVCFATTELGASLSATGVAFPDLRYIHFPDYNPKGVGKVHETEKAYLDSANTSITSLSILGVALGSFFGGKMIAIMGRRKLVIFGNVMFIVISLAEMWPNFLWLKVMRFLFGVATGFVMASAPKIIIETVPSHLLEYGFGSATNIFTFVSVSLLLIVGTFNGDEEEQRKHGSNWRVVFLIPIPFSVVSIIGLIVMYKRDSPTYLIETGAAEEEIMASIIDHVDISGLTYEDTTQFKKQLNRKIEVYQKQISRQTKRVVFNKQRGSNAKLDGVPLNELTRIDDKSILQKNLLKGSTNDKQSFSQLVFQGGDAESYNKSVFGYQGADAESYNKSIFGSSLGEPRDLNEAKSQIQELKQELAIMRAQNSQLGQNRGSSNVMGQNRGSSNVMGQSRGNSMVRTTTFIAIEADEGQNDQMVDFVNEIVDDTPVQPSYWEALSHPNIRVSTWMACWLGATNQLTQINVFSVYANTLLTETHDTFFVKETSAGALLGISGLIGCLISIGSIKLMSRRNVFLVGHLIQVVQWGLCGYAKTTQNGDLLLFMLMFWEVTFSASNGTCFWLYVAEITVDKALGIAVFVRMMTLYFLSLTTIPMIHAIGLSAWFYFWAAFQLFVCVFNFCFLKETQGLSAPAKKALYRPQAAQDMLMSAMKHSSKRSQQGFGTSVDKEL